MTAPYQPLLDSLQKLQGMLGCSLVEATSGMVVGSSGPHEWARRAESAVDHWRLHPRRDDLQPLGTPVAAVVMYPTCRITLAPCEGGFVLVCFSREPDGTDWQAWKTLLARLRAATRAL